MVDLAAGWLFVALAVLGILLPLLPTTPFVLLAGSCFIRSSPRARRWLEQNRWLGPPLRDWHEHRAVRRPVKVIAVVTVLLVIALTFARDLPWKVRIPIVALGTVGLLVIWRLPTAKPAPSGQLYN
jgi:hypothetical protein